MNPSGSLEKQSNYANYPHPEEAWAMIKRALASRLERLEDRLSANQQHKRYVVEFVAPGGTVVSTLTFEDGRKEWWYAPGHEPNDSTSSTHVDLQSVAGNA
jgi:hypothetical protein